MRWGGGPHYGWIEDPEPQEWHADLRFRRGEVVSINDVEVLADRTGIVTGFDRLGDGRSFRYYLQIAGERVSWVFPPDYLSATGELADDRLPPRYLPVLGEDTVVRLPLDDSEPEISGKLAFTADLYSVSDDGEPDGYTVRVAGSREHLPVPFAECEVAPGQPGGAIEGWIEDPEPAGSWPDIAELQPGERVRLRAGEPETGTVVEVTGYTEDGFPRYRVWVEGEPVMPVVSEAELVGTGMVEPDRLPPRLRPVLGDGTVVRVRETARTRELGIAGELALTANLHWGPGREPAGYAVRLPGEARLHLVPFGAFTVVRGNLPGL